MKEDSFRLTKFTIGLKTYYFPMKTFTIGLETCYFPMKKIHYWPSNSLFPNEYLTNSFAKRKSTITAYVLKKFILTQ